MSLMPRHVLQVWLVQPGLWKTIWSYALGPAEDALCIKALTLKNSQTGSTLKAAQTIVCMRLHPGKSVSSSCSCYDAQLAQTFLPLVTGVCNS